MTVLSTSLNLSCQQHGLLAALLHEVLVDAASLPEALALLSLLSLFLCWFHPGTVMLSPRRQ